MLPGRKRFGKMVIYILEGLIFYSVYVPRCDASCLRIYRYTLLKFMTELLLNTYTYENIRVELFSKFCLGIEIPSR